MSISFNGTNSYGTLSTNISFASPSAFTLEMWYKGTESRTNSPWGYGLLSWDSNYLFGILSLVGGKVNYVTCISGWTNISSSKYVNDNVWHHIALVNSNNVCWIYIDGVLDGTGSSVINSSYNMQITHIMRNYNGVYTLGNVSDIRVWNIAKTQSEISGYMKKRLIGNESGLVAYWECNETFGTNLINSVDNNDITLANTTFNINDEPIRNLFLLQDGNQIKSTDGSIVNYSDNLPFSVDKFNNYGISNVSLVNANIISKLINNKYKIAIYKK